MNNSESGTGALTQAEQTAFSKQAGLETGTALVSLMESKWLMRR